MEWKPKDKKAALCFTIDDIFPGKVPIYTKRVEI